MKIWGALDRIFETRLWKITEIVLFIYLLISLIELLIVFQYSIDFTLLLADKSTPRLNEYLRSALFSGTLAISVFCFLAIVKVKEMVRDYFVTQHYRALALSMLSFADGKISERFSKRSIPEVDHLGEAFNKMADSLQNLIEELRQSEKARKEITAHLAHDLAGPLTAIKGYLPRAIKTDQTSNAYSQIIEKNLETLSHLISELTEISRLEIDDLPLQPDTFSLRTLCHDIVSRFAVSAENRNITISVSESSDPAITNADLHMIERAISNLVENALRYTPDSGLILVNCSENEDFSAVEVRDDGSGIPGKDLPFVFERFYRVDKDRSRKSGGSGLGLAIVKKIIDAHKGKISIDSSPGKGTRVSLYLPKHGLANR